MPTNKRRTAGGKSTKSKNGFARKAERLRAEIEELQDSLFNINEKDPYLRHLNLKSLRDEVLRSFVISLHLAMEDLLHAILFDFLAKQNRRLTKKETIRIVNDMRSAELIHWCGRLKLISPLQYSNLLELNRIRNTCAHQWILDWVQIKRVGPRGRRKQIKIAVVRYKDQNLFSHNIFAEEFYPVYSRLYLKLLFRVWKLQGKL